ncbi:hypothetical protein CORC01_06957 [Colletotrichum orchidophilum]|uniref:Uncharacterized protein n=1 Tax=Colletotrichum orchidophilum TaxID=1209926 RepID=A0A1G4B903_9PEZI|nr:uncharacterized protein CORC01_06957 [Colletotrichum orchidophilum]OHE97752.1 hypothetical protein CORC01_06957 [Colletotrichum orchidophilum]
MEGKRLWPDDARCSPSRPLKRHRTLLDDWDSETRLSSEEIPLEHHRYTVAWICALPIELVAAEAMLDEKHDVLPSRAFYGNAYTTDTNTYTLGNIEGHNVVITCLPADQYGTNNAANVVTNLVRTFPSTRLALMVGIGGGVPSSARDIRLGDVVVGTRTMQYDLGKIVAGAEIQRTAIARTLHQSFGKAITVLRAKHDREPSQISSILKERFATLPHYGRPTAADRLFLSAYDHAESATTCDDCDQLKQMPRRARLNDDPAIHYGAIASGNQVMKNATERDNAARNLDVVCFEMEAAGIMDVLPCLPIRGICDYADSHKNKAWQRYAAAAAGACARELLSVLPSVDASRRAVHRPQPSQALLDQHQRQTQLMETLKFDQMDSRRSTVKKAHIKTCAWFIKHKDYQTWLSEENLKLHHGFLWIRGKPGAGKSTIMKFVLSKMQKDPRWSPLVVSFFFNARGEYLERSIEGMYRSLLFQVFQGYPQLRTVLDELCSTQQENEGCPNLDTLKDLFSEAILALGQLRLTCFIDALDECDEQQVTDMVRDFEDLAEEASVEGIAFRICFSSRHYPYIVIKRGVEMILENQPGHTQDMENYIKSRLIVKNPTFFEELQIKLLEKAAGVFLWLILVVDILNTEYSQGGLAMKKRLVEIPSDLGALFKDILTRDSKNMEHLFLCVIWILCAKRPLQPEEFYHALWSGLSQQDLVDPDPPKVTASDDEDNATRCVIGFSKGLAEITKSSRPTVQFIHESVRDYLLKAGGLAELWPELGFDWELPSHERLKISCDAYIGHYLASNSSAESLNQYPFMEYACQQVFFHADVAAAGISQDQFLSQFPLEKWIGIHNHFQKYKVRHYTPQASFVYIFAELDCSRLIRMGLSEDLQCRSAERYEYPLFAALAHGNSKSVAALLKIPSVIYNGTNIMEGFNHRKDLSSFKSLAPLSWAVENRRVGIATILLRAMPKFGDGDLEGDKLIVTAAQNGYDEIMKLLIEKGAGLTTQNGRLLHIACQRGHVAVAKVLIENGANVNATDSHSSRLLNYASSGGHVAVVKVLIENGANVNATDIDSRGPLHYASSGGHVAVVKVLIENGANVNATDIDSRGPLHHVSIGDHMAVAKLLIENGANVNKSDDNGLTPLHRAATWGRLALVKLLLDNQADPNAMDIYGHTPLYYAVRHDYGEMIQLLREKGAYVNAVSKDGETPAF